MNTENSSPENAPAPPQPEEIQDIRNYFRENGVKLLVMAGVVAVLVIGVWMYKERKKQSIVVASQILSAAKTPKDLETIVSSHASTPYAPLAMLKLAKNYFNAGDYDRAMAQYAEFKQKYPQHPMADGAELDRVYCVEAKGQTEEALKGFASFAESHTNHFLAPQSMFGQARCLEQLGRHPEARTIYEDFIAAHPDSGWVSKAEELLALNTRKLKGGKNDADTAGDAPVKKEEPKAPAEEKTAP